MKNFILILSILTLFASCNKEEVVYEDVQSTSGGNSGSNGGGVNVNINNENNNQNINNNSNIVQVLNLINYCEENPSDPDCSSLDNVQVVPYCLEVNNNWECNFPCDNGSYDSNKEVWLCSSHPLKGEKGDTGRRGPRGFKGEDGADGVCNTGNCCSPSHKQYCTATKTNKVVAFGDDTSLGNNWDFVVDAEFTYGTTSYLKGHLVKNNNSDMVFEVTLRFYNFVNSVSNGGMTPTNSPYFISNSTNTNSFEYYQNVEGTLIGKGVYSGSVLKITNRNNYAAQYGVGAGKNANNHLGLSAKLKYEILAQPTQGLISDCDDKNILDLTIKISCE